MTFPVRRSSQFPGHLCNANSSVTHSRDLENISTEPRKLRDALSCQERGYGPAPAPRTQKASLWHPEHPGAPPPGDIPSSRPALPQVPPHHGRTRPFGGGHTKPSFLTRGDKGPVPGPGIVPPVLSSSPPPLRTVPSVPNPGTAPVPKEHAHSADPRPTVRGLRSKAKTPSPHQERADLSPTGPKRWRHVAETPVLADGPVTPRKDTVTRGRGSLREPGFAGRAGVCTPRETVRVSVPGNHAVYNSYSAVTTHPRPDPYVPEDGSKTQLLRVSPLATL